MIELISEKYKIDKSKYNKIISFIASDLKLVGNATIKIGEEEESKSLNKQFRKKDYPTDVLTFISNEELPDGYYHGDIFICYQVLIKQAKEAEISEELELTTLIIHGLLHLKGYDHEIDSGEMLISQQNLLNKVLNEFINH